MTESIRSTINTVTLTCSNCGGGQFTKLGQNEYKCDHCGALTLVEDDVAQRLEHILRGLQPQPAAVPAVADRTALVAGAALAIVVGFATLWFYIQSSSSHSTPFAKPVDASRIKLTDPQVIHTWSGNKLLLIMRNDTGVTIDAPRVTGAFFSGEITMSSEWGDPTVRTLLPGEQTPVLLGLPDKPYTRYDLGMGEVRADDLQPAIVEARKVSLVRDGKSYRLAGLLTNHETVKTGLTQIAVMLYGDDGKLIGMGNGYAEATELAAGATTLFDVSCEMYADRPVAAYEYLVGAERSTDAGRIPVAKGPASRVTRVDKATVRDTGKLKLSTEELLDDDFKMFDNADLALDKPRQIVDELQYPRLLATVTNNSKAWIAVSPGAQPAFFDGHKALKLSQKWPLPARLYPGERVPVMFYGNFERYTEMKTDWAAAKRQALPGDRPKLSVAVEGTESKIGTGTMNFTYNYRYKYVKVRGRITNEDTRPVDDVKLWVSLYDAAGLLTGAQYKDHLMPMLQPGENAPFEVFVNQYGANYAKVETLYEATAK